MREIKFRAWFDGAMRGPETLDLIANHGFIWWEGSTLHEINPGHPDAIVMQYTGLHDKNGKEIYEGDILSKSLGASSLFDKTRPEIVEVKWGTLQDYEGSEVGVGFSGITPYDVEVDKEYYKENNIEVIGNIYENPELLKPVKVNG